MPLYRAPLCLPRLSPLGQWCGRSLQGGSAPPRSSGRVFPFNGDVAEGNLFLPVRPFTAQTLNNVPTDPAAVNALKQCQSCCTVREEFHPLGPSGVCFRTCSFSPVSPRSRRGSFLTAQRLLSPLWQPLQNASQATCKFPVFHSSNPVPYNPSVSSRALPNSPRRPSSRGISRLQAACAALSQRSPSLRHFSFLCVPDSRHLGRIHALYERLRGSPREFLGPAAGRCCIDRPGGERALPYDVLGARVRAQRQQEREEETCTGLPCVAARS